jgi:hypothetical protein
MNFSKVQFGKNTGMKGDLQDEKPLKYYTTNYFEDGLDQSKGINFDSGSHGPSSLLINQETALTRSISTNPRIRQNLGELPLVSTGGNPTSGPIISSNTLRERKSCLPSDVQFQDRRFFSFDKDPNAVQSEHSFRQGISTRNDTRTSYKKK